MPSKKYPGLVPGTKAYRNAACEAWRVKNRDNMKWRWKKREVDRRNARLHPERKAFNKAKWDLTEAGRQSRRRHEADRALRRRELDKVK